MAEEIFKGIKDYGFMHSSRFTTDAVTEATKLGLACMRNYLDLRMKTVDHCFDLKTQRSIKKDCI